MPNLSTAAQTWHDAITAEWSLDPPAMLILNAAMESYDRMKEAQAVVNAEGLLTTDRFGQQRPHPATLIERDSRQAMERALKSLNLDIEPIGAVGRPPDS